MLTFVGYRANIITVDTESYIITKVTFETKKYFKKYFKKVVDKQKNILYNSEVPYGTQVH